MIESKMSKKKTSNNTKKKKSEARTTTKKSKSTVDKPESTQRSIWFIVTIVIAVLGGVLSQAHSEEPSHQVHGEENRASEPAHGKENRANTHAPINSDASSINSNNGNSKRTKLSEVFDMACLQTGMARCGLADLEFDDEGRTILAKQKISRTQPLLEVSPDLQISSLTAVRDPRLKSLVDINPVIDLTGTAPTGNSWLAIYLVLEVNRLRTKTDDPDDWSPRDRVFRAWFDYLPTLEDFLMFHPAAQKIFQIKDDFFINGSSETDFSDENLPPFSTFLDQNIINISRKILYEYKAFSAASEDFGNDVSFEEYAWAQLIVSTRAFGRNIDRDNIDDDELEYLLPRLHQGDKEQLGVVMMPLIDAFNDRMKVNVQWNYNFDGAVDPLAITLFSTKRIEAGEELLVSYGGSKTDYQRLAQYGFANTNGLEISLATIAPYHRPAFVVPTDEEDRYVEIQKKKLFEYLNFGDGYEECPVPDVEEEGKVRRRTGRDDKLLQYARFKALVSIFHETAYWYVVMPSEDGKKKKLTVSEHVITMCRILAMTHRDYDGLAMPLLGMFAKDPMYETLKPSNNDALEYRAYHVLERLATESASEIRSVLAPLIEGAGEGGAVEAEARRRLESNELDRNSPEGMRAYVLYHEVESLQFVIAFAQKKKKFYLAKKQKKLDKGEQVNEEDYIVRWEHCKPKIPFDWKPYIK